MVHLSENGHGRLHHQTGFTLFELLITVGIIVALVAVIIPLVIQFASKGDEGSHSAEGNTVRTSLNSMMTENNVETVTPRLIAASAVIAPGETFGIVGGDTMADYMRMDGLDTVCSYYWDALGSVTQDPATTPCIP